MKVAARLNCGVAIEKGEDGWQADVLITSPKTGNHACVEIQLSPEPPEVTEARTRRRADAGVRTVWFFRDRDMLDLLPSSINRSPSLSLGGGDLESMARSLERQLTLYLKGRLAFDDFANLFETPVDLLQAEIECKNCHEHYDAIIGAVVRFEEKRGELPPLFVSVRSHRYFPDLARAIGINRPPDTCQKCKAPSPQIKIRAKEAVRAPQLSPPKVHDGTVFLDRIGIDDRPCWREKPQPPRKTSRMSRAEWERLTTRLLSEHKRELRQAAEKARRDKEEKARAERACRAERRNKVDQILWVILGHIPSEDAAKFREATWRTTVLPNFGATPDSIIDDLTSIVFHRLIRALDEVERMVTSNHIVAEFLGLPVDLIYHERVAAKEAQQRQSRRIRLCDTLRICKLVDDNWLNEPQSEFDGATPLFLAQESDESCSRVISEAQRENERRARKLERDRVTKECRTKLEDDARRSFPDEARAALWLHSSNPKLNRKRPAEFCEDAVTYARCREALIGQTSQRRKPR